MSEEQFLKEKSAPPAEQTESTAESGDRPLFRISVRALVEFLLREGDLDSRRQRGPDIEAALLGAKLHRKLQKSQAGPYESEVFFREDVDFPDLTVRVEGRADGVIAEADGGVTIDEIKGMYLDVEALAEPYPLHLAQAKCYAAMCAEERGLASVGIRMTYANLVSEEIHAFSFRYEAGALRGWFRELLRKWHRFASWQLHHRRARDASMRDMQFPFPYREGQQRLAATVYHSIKEKKQLFLMAPTGVGKTMSCVFPAIRAMGEGLGDRIFYLTAKNETLTSGQEAFSILFDKGLDFRAIRITSKEKLCPMREVSCNPDDCPYARGHFDRILDAVFDLVRDTRFIGREEILAMAEERQVCPFELTLDAASWCDAVLCDYNYAFDPDAQLKRFFGSGVKGDAIFLVDEAHNLVDRARDMYSAALVKEHVLSAKRAAGKGRARLARALERVNREMLALRHMTEDAPTGIVQERPYRLLAGPEADGLIRAAEALYFELQALYEDAEEAALREQLLDFYFELRSFAFEAGLRDGNVLIYAEVNGEKEFAVRIFTVNPAERITAGTDRGRAAIFFSATLLPLAYYRKLLTTREDPYAVYAPSPFREEKRLLLIARDVSTRYRDRTPDMYRRIAGYIRDVVGGKMGNYLVFFPSYKMLRDVFSVYRAEFDAPDADWVLQSPGMTDDDREIFLENFYESPARSLVGFCVMGGSFSEGLDLKGTRLIGAVVVGAGIPQVSAEREILKIHFGEEGFDYAYRYPGINKVEQAAGRVIRTAEDIGVIALLDSRLAGSDYAALFPREWSSRETCTARTVAEKVRVFWARPADRP